MSPEHNLGVLLVCFLINFVIVIFTGILGVNCGYLSLPCDGPQKYGFGKLGQFSRQTRKWKFRLQTFTDVFLWKSGTLFWFLWKKIEHCGCWCVLRWKRDLLPEKQQGVKRRHFPSWWNSHFLFLPKFWWLKLFMFFFLVWYSCRFANKGRPFLISIQDPQVVAFYVFIFSILK